MIKFLIEIAVLHTLFYVIWSYVFSLPIILLSTFLNDSPWGGRFAKGIGAVVFSSLSAIIVLDHQKGIGTLIFYSFLAGLFMLFNLVSSHGEARKKAITEFDFLERAKIELELSYDYIYSVIAVVFFILTLFLPIIGANPVNNLFMLIMNWVLDFKIINWIVIVISSLLFIFFIGKGIGLIFTYLRIRKNIASTNNDI